MSAIVILSAAPPVAADAAAGLAVSLASFAPLPHAIVASAATLHASLFVIRALIGV